jgi:hypothetical protein
MRILLLSLVATAAAGKPDTLTCAIDGAGALDSAVNAGVYLWASTERCAENGAKYDGLKCEIDVTSALKSVIDMTTIITSAVQSCAGEIETVNAQCGQAAGQLASATVGLAAGAGSVTHWIQRNSTGGTGKELDTKIGKCVIDVKSIANDIFLAAAGIKSATAGCKKDKGEKCAAHALAVVSVLSNLGSAIAHSIAHCPASGNKTAAMSGDIMNFVSVLDNVALAGIAIDEKCKVDDSRLFSIQSVENSNNGGNMLTTSNLVLASLVPLGVVAGYLSGRRQQTVNPAQTRDMESMGMLNVGDDSVE